MRSDPVVFWFNDLDAFVSFFVGEFNRPVRPASLPMIWFLLLYASLSATISYEINRVVIPALYFI